MGWPGAKRDEDRFKMPIEGPEGLILLFPHDAYDAIGRHKFQDEWEGGYFHTGPKLPDYETVNRQLEAGTISRADTPAGLEEGQESYERRQVRARRSIHVFNLLFETLSFDKAGSWRKNINGKWEAISYSAWDEDKDLKILLEDCLDAQINKNDPAPVQIGIEKEGLEKFLRGWAMSTPAGESVTEVTRARNRPSIDLDMVIKKLLKWEATGKLKSWVNSEKIHSVRRGSGWRIEVCRLLLRKKLNWYPTAKSPKLPPNAETLRDLLKDTFDDIEVRASQPR